MVHSRMPMMTLEPVISCYSTRDDAACADLPITVLRSLKRNGVRPDVLVMKEIKPFTGRPIKGDIADTAR